MVGIAFIRAMLIYDAHNRKSVEAALMMSWFDSEHTLLLINQYRLQTGVETLAQNVPNGNSTLPIASNVGPLIDTFLQTILRTWSSRICSRSEGYQRLGA